MSDYIDRNRLKQGIQEDAMTALQGWDSSLMDLVMLDIDEIPAADVEPERNGRWEECDWVDVDEHGFGTRRTFKAGLRCNQCACVFKKKLLWKRNYCPSCGAKMDLEGENHVGR